MSDRSPIVPSGSTAVFVERTGSRPLLSRWRSFGLQIVTVLIFFASSLLAWIFGFTFWTILEALVRAFGLQQGHGFLPRILSLIFRQHAVIWIADGWPIDVAFVLALLVTWCCLYLAFDHLAFWGNPMVKRALASEPAPPGEERFLVELRMHHSRHGILPDIGVLSLTPEGLQFEGQRQRMLIAREVVGSNILLRRSIGDLAAAYVFVPLLEGEGTIQLLARDNATRLSETIHDARRLDTALRGWLDGTSACTEDPTAS